jgi:predicted cupin superfamily sugar epimerase
MQNAEYWIQQLNLLPHPEGGFYKEVYRSSLKIRKDNLPHGFNGERRLCTSIYFLLRSGDISKFHRLHSDEIWYYHFGGSLKIIQIDQEGNKHTCHLGTQIEKSEQMQILIPAGTIFGAELLSKNTYGLFSCVVAPGFEFEDFEMFDREDLIQAYPKHSELIEHFT